MGVTCNLSMKQGSLFLFCCSCWDLSDNSASCHSLGIFGKLSMRRGCIDLVWEFFGAMVWKLLIIEPFSPWKLNKIETENCIGIWGVLGVVGKPLMNEV